MKKLYLLELDSITTFEVGHATVEPTASSMQTRSKDGLHRTTSGTVAFTTQTLTASLPS